MENLAILKLENENLREYLRVSLEILQDVLDAVGSVDLQHLFAAYEDAKELLADFEEIDKERLGVELCRQSGE